MQQEQDQILPSKHMTETAKMRTLRKLVEKTRFDRTRSQDMRRQCNVQEAEEWITEGERRMERACFEDGTKENCENCKRQLSYR
jgi:hypothetical protein